MVRGFHQLFHSNDKQPSRFQFSLPLTDKSKNELAQAFPQIIDMSVHFFGEGNVKTAITDLHDIGTFVERIISDMRTLNRYVFCWAEEWTMSELFDLGEKLSKDEFVKKEVRSLCVLF